MEWGKLQGFLQLNVGSLSQQSLSSKYFLNECLSSEDHLIKEAAEWAKQAISRAICI
ncbi:putative importin beta family [Helianthus annuus]|nr:putative importin beta family [Helianthus annuus]